MKSRRRATLLLALAVGASLLPAAARAEEPDHVVQAGAVHPTNPLAPYEFTSYYPEMAKVHRGDTVKFTFAGFHTVTFLEDDDAAKHPSFFRADDNVSGAFALSQRMLEASECSGTPDGCVLSDTGSFLSAAGDFKLTVDLGPGAYRYHCLIHPSMHGFVQVLPDEAALPAKEDVAAEVAAQIAADAQAADDLVADNSVPQSRTEGNRKIWTVYAGDATGRVAVLGYMPSSLNVARGDSVEFVSGRPGIKDEIHTVTFPAAAVGEGSAGGFLPFPMAGTALFPACDVDDVNGGAPSIYPFIPIPPCPGTFEVIWSRYMTQSTSAPNDQVATPATYHDSGLLVPEAAPGWARGVPSSPPRNLPSTWSASFPNAGTFDYACNLHTTFMSGSITVA
ncbi:MAG TPA: hypothetical protein VM600_03090 [Actinomycetota bacterium]|nr:hypothetical protein [Actinomycetota bacterium]